LLIFNIFIVLFQIFDPVYKFHQQNAKIAKKLKNFNSFIQNRDKNRAMRKSRSHF